MDVNEHDINIMNEWRRGEKNRMLKQGNTMKMHNGPKCSAVPNLLRREMFLFTTNLSSSQFPKHELSSQSIRKLS